MEQMLYPTLLLFGGVALIVGLGVYQRLSVSAERESDDPPEEQKDRRSALGAAAAPALRPPRSSVGNGRESIAELLFGPSGGRSALEIEPEGGPVPAQLAEPKRHRRRDRRPLGQGVCAEQTHRRRMIHTAWMMPGR